MLASTNAGHADTLFVPQEYFTIQEAINAAADDDVVLVAPGLYREAIDFLGKSIVVRSVDGPDVTAIDASWHFASVATFRNGERATAILDGFALTGGAGTRFDRGRRGGGVFILNASPTIQNCVIRGIALEDDFSHTGAGAFIHGASDPTFVECSFLNNEAYYGGGIYVGGSAHASILDSMMDGNSGRHGSGLFVLEATATVIGSEFSHNDSQSDGGAVAIREDASARIDRCEFRSNTARGGGALIIGPESVGSIITNSLLVDNSADSGGALDLSYDSVADFVNCVIYGNEAQHEGSAIRAYQAIASLFNCVVRSNGDDPIAQENSSLRVSYSNLEGGFDGGIGIIDADPLFVDPRPEALDFRLRAGSPCVDAGDSRLVPIDALLDLAGAPRLVDDAGMPDRGYGDPVTVDMGAFERQVESEFVLALSTLPIRARSTVHAAVFNATPHRSAWLAYSVTGLGATPVPPLNIVLDLEQPVGIGTPRTTNESGDAQWRNLPIGGVKSGTPVWFQAAQHGAVSNYVGTIVTP